MVVMSGTRMEYMIVPGFRRRVSMIVTERRRRDLMVLRGGRGRHSMIVIGWKKKVLIGCDGVENKSLNYCAEGSH